MLNDTFSYDDILSNNCVIITLWVFEGKKALQLSDTP